MGLPWAAQDGETPNSVQDQRLATARAWKRAGEISSNILDCGYLFVSPSWNMMLEAYIARREHRRLSTKAVAASSGAPFTSSLRYLTALIDKGLLSGSPDPHDARRRFIAITQLGNDLMEIAFDKAVESDRSLGLARLQLIE